MDFDEDPLDLLEDDNDSVNEMILLFDSTKDDKLLHQGQETGCSVVLAFMGMGGVMLGLVLLSCLLN